VGQAAQAPVVVAIGPIAVGHQPVGEGLAKDALEHLAAALADDEQGGTGAGEDPQPQQPATLFPTGHVGMDQLGFAYRTAHLTLDHRLNRTAGLMDALVDGRHPQVQPQPVVQEFLDACP
jgi:hypothetical protein